MNVTIWKSMSKVVLVGAIALVSVIYLASANNAKAKKQAEQGQSEPQTKRLEGTWRVEITLRVCQTGAEIRRFPALSTFAKGGTLHATAAGASPARVGPDYGIWWSTAEHSYAAVSEALLFGPTGDWTGTQRVTRAIEIGDDPDTLTADTSVEILDVNRNLVGTGCATAVGVRLSQ